MRDETPRALLPAVRSMARREAAALLLHPRLEAWLTAPAVTVSLRVIPCPWPGCATPPTPTGLLPVAAAESPGRGERPAEGTVTLSALSCEWLSARALLPLALGGAGGRVPRAVTTRAAALVRLLARTTPGAWVAGLPELDARERWLDGTLAIADVPPTADSWPAEPVLPASSRRLGQAHMVSPHLAAEETRALNDAYMTWRRSAVTAAFEQADKGQNGA
ncbi:hypothetical protein GCM10022224_023630 [Nonomuraea antimicrobica]|uniref:Uncharacterized protein n=1 Tax=Nonomuraea antimicrobica TaxID=561173 RepID=A0ABP7BFU1_9ACTN